MTIDSEAYRIAEEAHKGVDDEYIRAMCDQADIDLGLPSGRMYRLSENYYVRYFERG
jgi:hypothetical protein